MSRKYFGTDGIRGRVGEGVVTAEFMLKLGWAAGKVFNQKGYNKILIGKDTRISGYMFESALEAGLSAAGVDVYLLGPMPTPGIAYLTRTFHAQAGIVISASHNPFEDNGIKFFSAHGTKLPDEVEAAIEAQLDEPMVTVSPDKLGKAKRIADAAGRYIEFCKSTFPNDYDLNGLKIVLDCAHGATYHIAPSVFTELGAEVIAIGAQPNGLNINEGVGSTSPAALQAAVLEHQADLGVAFDGDGDRVAMVDQQGRLLDGDDLLYIIATDMQREDMLCGGVVGTLMSNYGLEKAFAELNIPFTRAKVGDRYVMAELKANDWRVGGENSGHIVCQHVQTTGDGIVSALQVMAAVARSGKSLSELLRPLNKLPQVLINVRLGQASAERVQKAVAVQAKIAEVTQTLEGRGRLLLRPSGTEPLIRVMTEGENRVEVTALAEGLAAVIEQEVAI
ncbi:phosphoglucosamine mutase [Oceanospirillum linum]|uniref:Phosphoglucosamine mutase n=1 Tax=Oceanospirillum linum TaxID=966 RepID=A0A1T1H8T9_OCELI|nr:phosphoglucosamine mutase [Oceanospirillum linum]OOV86225.1 phosphoglucosamine mutase [Oceanospirillum linum]SEG37883.1 phosphoglucosamine mutase [Oleiphilus messinensis]SMP32235.1 phosphoglucosamine mutase [Oceanospirillum linum]